MPDVASIMELLKGSLASLEKRLLGKKDPRSAVPNSFCRDLTLFRIVSSGVLVAQRLRFFLPSS